MANLMPRTSDPFRALFTAFPSFGNGYGYGVDVQKTENGWSVEIPVPGLAPEQIEVTAEDRVLTVNGKNERRSFQRSILLPEEVDASAIEAKVEHGLLALTLPLHAKAQPRRIAVNVVN
ncbi:MAG TPA: Hsp20/alpha crystallin family protein [Candidatus Limnocylindria bacterium]|jgi:HSP20 family protein|nr:Hsp20/alpha crystallin family protein [Candidatus Limnocylindria bacterium]